MSDIPKNACHGMINEIAFIAKIGTFSPQHKTSRAEKIKLLSGYLAGLQRRTCWKNLDREKLLAFAQTELMRHQNASSCT